MQRISSILPRIIKTFGLESNLQLRKLSNSWVQIVGDTIALHSSPERLRQEILYVAVDSPIWMQQLSFFKKELIEKVNRETGKKLISDIRFIVGDVKIPESTIDIRQSTVKLLTPEDMEEIEQSVAAINDHEIKESVKKAITKALQKLSG